MIRALSTAATGMEAQQTKIDVVANNLANVSTAGFKKSRADFADLLYETIRQPGTSAAQGREVPVGIHPLVEYTHHIDYVVAANPVVQRVRSDNVLAVTGADIIAGPSDRRI